MWEKFKEWFQSYHFPWFMCGWQLGETLSNPSLWNIAFLGFWIWVLASDD